ncbi:MAG: hypothetical protein C0603_06205 [Denitrovibrio sp.]|nr:MAG: hypothetical protein C0603_06205 [Denitrovibrio sp.]
MRFILTGIVWLVIVSAVSLLFSSRDSEVVVTKITKADKVTSVAFEITTTFSVEEDPFALDIGEEKGAFQVILDGATIFSTEDGVKDRITFTTDEYEISSGKHELFIKANPTTTELSNSVRIRVLSDGNPITDETMWFQPGQTINAAHIFELKGEGDHYEH